MAAQLALPRVHGQSRVAAFAACDVAAAGADQCRRKAAAIEKYQDLAVFRQVATDGLGQRLADALGGRCPQRVDQAYFGRPGATGAPR